MDNITKEIVRLMESAGKQPSMGPLDAAHDIRPLTITEGLITTYPTDKVIKSLTGNFNLTVNGKTNEIDILWKVRGLEPPKPNGDIKVEKPNGYDETIVVTLPRGSEFYDAINSHLLKYGWFNYRTDEEGSSLKYCYEKKFGDRFSVKQILNVTNYIYHVTSVALKRKIKTQGLAPKESKTPGFTNEPRIYFRPDLPTLEDATALVSMKEIQNKPMVVEVDLRKLNPNQSFFFDSRWRNSIFTFEPVPPTAIRIMFDDELPKIKLC